MGPRLTPRDEGTGHVLHRLQAVAAKRAAARRRRQAGPAGAPPAAPPEAHPLEQGRGPAAARLEPCDPRQAAGDAGPRGEVAQAGAAGLHDPIRAAWVSTAPAAMHV
jgi:hypothetical protein